jgi:hypothetical protein
MCRKLGKKKIGIRLAGSTPLVLLFGDNSATHVEPTLWVLWGRNSN